MGFLKDYKEQHLTSRWRYWLPELINLRNIQRTIKWRKQRAERGWSDRDTWNGGEYIAEVLVGILRYLDQEQNPIDWDEYFKMNYPNNYGYNSLSEVADDLDIYLQWNETIQWQEPLYSELSNDERWAIDHQVYEQAKNAMHFVAEHIGGLWW